MDRERWMTTEEVAHLLGVTRQTISRWIREGRLPARAIASGPRVIYRIRYSAFIEFVRRYVRDSD
jgi:excisionase family DNA binding protein